MISDLHLILTAPKLNKEDLTMISIEGIFPQIYYIKKTHTIFVDNSNPHLWCVF